MEAMLATRRSFSIAGGLNRIQKEKMTRQLSMRQVGVRRIAFGQLTVLKQEMAQQLCLGKSEWALGSGARLGRGQSRPKCTNSGPT